MKTLFLLSHLTIVGASYLNGAVIFRTVDQNLPPGAPTPPVVLDLDQNGNPDLEIRPVTFPGSIRLVVISPPTTGIMWLNTSESAFGGLNLES